MQEYIVEVKRETLPDTTQQGVASVNGKMYVASTEEALRDEVRQELLKDAQILPSKFCLWQNLKFGNAIFPAVALILIALSSMWSLAFPAGLGILVAAVLLLKALTRRERPDASDRLSFPSGHAAVSVYIAGVYTVLAPVNIWVGIAVSAWAVMTCIARVATMRHYVTDVIAGALIAVSALHIFTALMCVT
jgi:membrane-associated phospholipid phosphatase